MYPLPLSHAIRVTKLHNGRLTVLGLKAHGEDFSRILLLGLADPLSERGQLYTLLHLKGGLTEATALPRGYYIRHLRSLALSFHTRLLMSNKAEPILPIGQYALGGYDIYATSG
jgi:hypothetical protein